MDLLKSENSDFISCPALSHMKTKHYNEPDTLPSTDDLVRLKEYTDNRLESLSQQLKSEPTYATMRSLSEIVLTQLLVFNNRMCRKCGLKCP